MRLAPIFSDGMILQRGEEVRVYGEVCGHVSVTFDGVTKETDAWGKFLLSFPAHEAGGPYEMTVTAIENETVSKTAVKDILFGDVFLVSGQSNAELPICETYARTETFDDCDAIRCYKCVPLTDDGTGKLTQQGSQFNEKWVPLKTGNAWEWSAIGLHLARRFYREKRIPIGIIAAYKGASAIQTFLSPEANTRFPYVPEKIHEDHFAFRFNVPGLFHRFLLEPLFPYAVCACVWYQGESNRTLFEASFYDEMLKTLIAEIRKGVGIPSLPFAVIQINRFPVPCEEGVLAIMEAQERACAVTDACELIRIADMGEHEKIHPENKYDVAMRVCDALAPYLR